MIGKPPDTVPDDLTGEEYYQLGSWYFELSQFGNLNYIEKAREALNRAIAQDNDQEAARKSKILLACRFLTSDIPKEAIERCEKMRLSVLGNPAEAASGYEQLIAQYPKFERPYKRLAEIRLGEGNVDECIKLLESALKINPRDAPAMDVMAQALAAKMDYVGSKEFLEQALDSTPDSERQQLVNFRRSLQIVAEINA